VLYQIPKDISTASEATLLTVSKHELEAWTMNFDILGAKCLSGGDDAALVCNLLSGLPESERVDDVQPVLAWKNRRVHSAGVTAILPISQDMILTGSYDDHLRLISLSKPPQVLKELNLGGGVWRLKLLSSSEKGQYDVLASCMHAGARIVRIIIQEHAEVGMDVLARFEEHESMNYGCEFVRDGEEYEYTVLSTSFYDKRLCLWKFTAPKFEDSTTLPSVFS
jgi:diphthamide biosynthesis protein 7